MLFGKEREKEEKINLANCAITTIVGSDTVVEGTIITKSSVRIDGTLIGGVSAEGVVILTKNGKIRGNVMAENIIVAGVVEGNMQIREKVDVEPSGEIYGDITTKKLLIDEESIFQGNCYMNRDKQAEKVKQQENVKAQENMREKEAEDFEKTLKPDKKEDIETAAENIEFHADYSEIKKASGKKVTSEKKTVSKKTVSAGKTLQVVREEDGVVEEISEQDNMPQMMFEEEQAEPDKLESEEIETMLAEAEEDSDMDFLDVDVKRNRNITNDRKRRRR